MTTAAAFGIVAIVLYALAVPAVSRRLAPAFALQHPDHVVRGDLPVCTEATTRKMSGQCRRI